MFPRVVFLILVYLGCLSLQQEACDYHGQLQECFMMTVLGESSGNLTDALEKINGFVEEKLIRERNAEEYKEICSNPLPGFKHCMGPNLPSCLRQDLVDSADNLDDDEKQLVKTWIGHHKTVDNYCEGMRTSRCDYRGRLQSCFMSALMGETSRNLKDSLKKINQFTELELMANQNLTEYKGVCEQVKDRFETCLDDQRDFCTDRALAQEAQELDSEEKYEMGRWIFHYQSVRSYCEVKPLFDTRESHCIWAQIQMEDYDGKIQKCKERRNKKNEGDKIAIYLEEKRKELLCENGKEYMQCALDILRPRCTEESRRELCNFMKRNLETYMHMRERVSCQSEC